MAIKFTPKPDIFSGCVDYNRSCCLVGGATAEQATARVAGYWQYLHALNDGYVLNGAYVERVCGLCEGSGEIRVKTRGSIYGQPRTCPQCKGQAKHDHVDFSAEQLLTIPVPEGTY